MNRFVLSAFGILLAAAVPASSQQIEWKDPSPHAVKFVTVEEKVKLEVLDWGGTGRALVLLAGLGATAHHFDDLAPSLTSRYRVLAITRRAHPGSSTPPMGYGFGRLAEDVIRVIDAMGVSRPIVIGHSFAGEEMHILGARYSEKISGLVYIDAAFDRGDNADTEAYNAVARTLPGTPGPEPADLVSFAALRAFQERTFGFAQPEAFLRARFLTNTDGRVGSEWSPDLPIRQEITREMRAAYNPYNPERIRVPAMAIYAVPKSPDDLMRRGSSSRMPFPENFIARTADDPALRERVEKLYQLTRERFQNHAKWFEAFAEGGRVVELSGNHDLIVSNPREVVAHIEAFVSSLPEKL
jgi:pimeloyl-ACP methyl ester carboxylesterase